MADFFNQPILNSPYEWPTEHWELGQQLESGATLDANLRQFAKDEIERFRREVVDRPGRAAAPRTSRTKNFCARR